MYTLGTQNFWKPHVDKNDKSQKESQILKNQGYISIFVEKVFYNSRPTFFQKLFGGKDKVAIVTTATYKTPGQSDIEAKIVLGASSLRANASNTLSKNSLIALNIPTHADGIEIKTSITSIKKDNFEKTIELLSDEAFQQPLNLDPIGIGQISAMAKLVNRIFSSDPNREELEGSFAGLISNDTIENPVRNNRLTEGYLILISNQDKKNPFWNNFKEDLLSYDGTSLSYNGQPIDLTHIVYSIHFDKYRGEDENSVWAKKYQSAISKLDELLVVFEDEKKKGIIKEAFSEWKNGNLLLDNDSTYTLAEKKAIRDQNYLKIINTIKTNNINPFTDIEVVATTEKLLGHSPSDNDDLGLEVNEGVKSSDNLSYADKLLLQLNNNVNSYLKALNKK